MVDTENTAGNSANDNLEIAGVIQSGAGQGAYFMSVDWVVAQCRDNLGYSPFPGTLNVTVSDLDLKKLESLYQETDFELVPDDPNFCAAGVVKIMLNGIAGAIVLPSEDVRIHENRVVEILSHCNLKKTLGVADGDTVIISWPPKKK